MGSVTVVLGLFSASPAWGAAPAGTSRRGGDMGMRTQSPVGGVTKAGVQEGEQVLHWKLSISAHSSRCGNTGIHIPDRDSPRRLSLTSESAEERKGTASAVHRSGRRSRCRGPPSCFLKPVPSFARALLWRFCYSPESPVLLWDQKETACQGHRALGFHHRPGQPRLLSPAL